MKNLNSAQTRQAFIDYFKKNGHTVVASSSLIPENDDTLLFANAGMNQFKNTFLGSEKRDYVRAVSSQKCVRAGGKHNDLENVGFTARHHTFFEMLGNFSFGDYFKKDAIHFAWEFLTKELQIPKEKLYVTVFETDDEAADIWHKQEGVPKDRIFRLGEKDNFWRMGDVGPCGPCSEIFFDHGPLAGRESDPFKGIVAGEDRYVEIWNLVFMQFYESAPGKMTPLPKPSVDTGSGLERVVAALQGRYNNYNTDLFTPIIQVAAAKKGWDIEQLIQAEMKLRQDPQLAQPYPGMTAAQLNENLAALRVMADHVRSTSFLIADGAMPANEGRGYVLRRIIRRAIRYGRKLSEKDSFLADMSLKLIEQMGDAYPELKARKEQIISTIQTEESRFSQTLDQGIALLNDEIAKAKNKTLSGATVFKLYDTFGFPVDLTKLMAEEKGLTIDEAGFEKEMEVTRTRSKASWKAKGIESNEQHLISFAQSIGAPTKFIGYDSMAHAGTIAGLSNGETAVKNLKAGESGVIILDQTPFYAEGGGQVGDQGEIEIPGGKAKARVMDTRKIQEVFAHFVEVTSGEFKVGDKVGATVEASLRRQTMGNHSATHLMHAALRQVLGTHVTQAGSIVDPERLRFDFTHTKPTTPEEIQQIENLVNEQIAHALPVTTALMSPKEAIAAGAMALFGEKYGDTVRVLKMGDFSCELCGGTHVSNTSQIRLFKIISEGGVSAGVRRIEALTGTPAFNWLNANSLEALAVRNATGSKEPLNWIEGKKTEIRTLEKEIKKLQAGSVNVDELVKGAQEFKLKSGEAARLVFADLGLDDRDALTQIMDKTLGQIKTGIVVLVGQGEASHPIMVGVSKNALGDHKAGDVLKIVAGAMGGKGGGKPELAQGAAPDRSKLGEARTQVKSSLGLH